MPNKYPVNPAQVRIASFKVARGVRSGLPRAQAKVSRKTATILRLQDRTSNQLFRLAAVAGALRKKALNKGDGNLANAAQTVASSAGRLARTMWRDYTKVAAATNQLLAAGGPQGGLRSPSVRIARQPPRAAKKSSRPKGPVSIVDPSSLGRAIATLKAAQRELIRSAGREQDRR